MTVDYDDAWAVSSKEGAVTAFASLSRLLQIVLSDFKCFHLVCCGSLELETSKVINEAAPCISHRPCPSVSFSAIASPTLPFSH